RCHAAPVPISCTSRRSHAHRFLPFFPTRRSPDRGTPTALAGTAPSPVEQFKQTAEPYTYQTHTPSSPATHTNHGYWKSRGNASANADTFTSMSKHTCKCHHISDRVCIVGLLRSVGLRRHRWVVGGYGFGGRVTGCGMSLLARSSGMGLLVHQG